MKRRSERGSSDELILAARPSARGRALGVDGIVFLLLPLPCSLPLLTRLCCMSSAQRSDRLIQLRRPGSWKTPSSLSLLFLSRGGLGPSDQTAAPFPRERELPGPARPEPSLTKGDPSWHCRSEDGASRAAGRESLGNNNPPPFRASPRRTLPPRRALTLTPRAI